MAEVKAILFDLDNTLVDFWKMKRLASRAAIKAMIKAGLRIDYKKAWKMLYEMFSEYGIENQKIFDIFLKEVTSEVDIKILAAGVVAYRKVKDRNMKAYPNVPDTLRKLRSRRLKLAIISDAPRFQAWSRLFDLKLEKYFDFVIALEDTGQKKPSQLPFKAAIKKLGLKPQQMMMVGDDASRDIFGAKKLGMITVLARYGQVWGEPRKAEPDFIINNFSEILKIV